MTTAVEDAFPAVSSFLDSNTSYVCKIGFQTAPVTLHLTGACLVPKTTV
jgi:hypothetical protein